MKRVIVTGANGFMGSGLLHELAATGCEIYAVLRSPKSDVSYISDIEGLHFVYCEMNHYELLQNMLPEGGFDAFYHLAWEGTLGDDRANCYMHLDNCRNTLTAAMVTKKLRCKKFICTGTITEFVARESLEKDYSSQNMIYAISKHYTHVMLNVFCKMNDIQYVWAIMSNTFGIGKPIGNIMSYLINTLLDGKETAFSSAEQPYDCIFLEDAVRGLRLLGECDNHHHTYFIGSGQPRILKEYLLAAGQIVAPNQDIGIGKRPEDNLVYEREWFDTSALREDTQFMPKYTFEEAIKITAEWLKQQKKK